MIRYDMFMLHGWEGGGGDTMIIIISIFFFLISLCFRGVCRMLRMGDSPAHVPTIDNHIFTGGIARGRARQQIEHGPNEFLWFRHTAHWDPIGPLLLQRSTFWRLRDDLLGQGGRDVAGGNSINPNPVFGPFCS